ncbi:MAG: hypothetical protein QGG98_07675 [Pseudomonadales bacterium]|jgi:hypothetical protein|nr:hypothetical protein [Pseudomonadales bacterium]MDP7357114.1 hypothetical protein [Pseudomonadales bacterium]HJN51474.1 hypothetical protein [Pseudomonadales bacterium]|tara:strand:- start:406 stop:633 length:228 start_codon:yes stop_codon:yes gene_type:complete
MASITEIERALLELAPSERERLALKAWESLIADPEAVPSIDPEGISLAASRNDELDRWRVEPISHDEFRRRTSRK